MLGSRLVLFVALVAATAQDRTAFIGVNVIPMDSERILRDQTVLVEDANIRKT